MQRHSRARGAESVKPTSARPRRTGDASGPPPFDRTRRRLQGRSTGHPRPSTVAFSNNSGRMAGAKSLVRIMRPSGPKLKATARPGRKIALLFRSLNSRFLATRRVCSAPIVERPYGSLLELPSIWGRYCAQEQCRVRCREAARQSGAPGSEIALNIRKSFMEAKPESGCRMSGNGSIRHRA
jgi:hypothetical protein